MSDMGFDLDEETIETFDAILLALTTDPELKEEFTKLKFIQTLKDKYDGSAGPMKQLFEKIAKMEQNNVRMEQKYDATIIDMQRAVRDMVSATRAISEAALAQDRETMQQKLRLLEGIQCREKHYSWNHK